AGLQGRAVERAPGAAREPRPVEEDAGVADHPRHEAPFGRAADRSTAADGQAPVLPLLVGQPVRSVEDRLRVVLVDHVRPVAAAAELQLEGRPAEAPMAPVAVDAHPRAGQERDVEDPGAVLVRGVERHELVHVAGWGGRVRHAGTTLPHRGPATPGGRHGAVACWAPPNRRSTTRSAPWPASSTTSASGWRPSARSWPTSPSSASASRSTPAAPSSRSTSAA